ncbi:hypothetical protein [Clostridium sp. M14]|nr:hypothetical protein [Clostridium sp. M14]MBZ9692024.1 hypothetical protein [Clostridium sp. M14]
MPPKTDGVIGNPSLVALPTIKFWVAIGKISITCTLYAVVPRGTVT